MRPRNKDGSEMLRPTWRALSRGQSANLEAMGVTCSRRECQGLPQYLVTWVERYQTRGGKAVTHHRLRLCSSHFNTWHDAACRIHGEPPKHQKPQPRPSSQVTLADVVNRYERDCQSAGFAIGPFRVQHLGAGDRVRTPHGPGRVAWIRGGTVGVALDTGNHRAFRGEEVEAW